MLQVPFAGSVSPCCSGQPQCYLALAGLVLQLLSHLHCVVLFEFLLNGSAHHYNCEVVVIIVSGTCMLYQQKCWNVINKQWQNAFNSLFDVEDRCKGLLERGRHSRQPMPTSSSHFRSGSNCSRATTSSSKARPRRSRRRHSYTVVSFPLDASRMNRILVL